ncbi:MAG: hypothetical protein KAI66_06400, partial [Lentisphaeria bacterium]|nr:hypothetical protein [Lentisphaeria bacterium]
YRPTGLRLPRVLRLPTRHSRQNGKLFPCRPSGYIPDAESYEADSYETNPTIMHRPGQLAGKEMLEEGKALLANVGGIGASFE